MKGVAGAAQVIDIVFSKKHRKVTENYFRQHWGRAALHDGPGSRRRLALGSLGRGEWGYS